MLVIGPVHWQLTHSLRPVIGGTVGGGRRRPSARGSWFARFCPIAPSCVVAILDGLWFLSRPTDSQNSDARHVKKDESFQTLYYYVYIYLREKLMMFDQKREA